MKEYIKIFISCFVGAFVILIFTFIFKQPNPSKNIPINWKNLKEMPVQNNGRVMPFDSFSRVTLTQFSGKSSIEISQKETEKKKKISAIEWLSKTIFAQSTDDYPVFLVENPRVAQALKLGHDDDLNWYSYNDLKNKIDAIANYAKQAAGVKSENQSIFEKQILNLSTNIFQFEALRATFSFWHSKGNLVGYDKFYKEILPTLGKMFKNNPKIAKEIQGSRIVKIVNFPYQERRDNMSIAEYLDHLYIVEQVFLRFGMRGMVNEVIKIEESLHNKEIRNSYSESFKMMPPQLKWLPFFKHVDEVKNITTENKKYFKKEFAFATKNKYINDDFALTKYGKSYWQELQQYEEDKESYVSWKSPWYVFYVLFKQHDYRKNSLRHLNSIYSGFTNNDWQKVDTGASEFVAFNATLIDNHITKSTSLEVTYNHYDFFFYSMLLYLISAIYCLFSWLSGGKKYLFAGALFTIFLAYFLHTCGLTMRVIIKSRPPVSTLYESIVFAAWVGVTLSFIMEYFSRVSKTISLFTGAIGGYILMAIASKYATDGDNLGVLVAVLDSNFWLSTHVTSMIIGYSACMIAGGIGHMYILMHAINSNYDSKKAKELSQLIYGTLCFGTIISFLGTILGGLWADQSWGRFWGWDPKENGAMLIVLWNVILLHARLGGYIRDWGLALGAIFGNLVVAAAWWGVNLLSVGLHNYGFSEGILGRLVIFAVIELSVIGFGLYLWKIIKSKKISSVKSS